MVYLTKEEREKFSKAVQEQQQEIWNESKKNRYKRTWYYDPPLRKRGSEWLKIHKNSIEWIITLVIGIIIYYLVVTE